MTYPKLRQKKLKIFAIINILSGETLNRGPLALLLLRQYEFHSGINLVQFSSYSFSTGNNYNLLMLHFSRRHDYDYALHENKSVSITKIKIFKVRFLKMIWG